MEPSADVPVPTELELPPTVTMLDGPGYLVSEPASPHPEPDNSSTETEVLFDQVQVQEVDELVIEYIVEEPLTETEGRRTEVRFLGVVTNYACSLMFVRL